MKTPIIVVAAFLFILLAASIGGAAGDDGATPDPLDGEMVRAMHRHGFSDEQVLRARGVCLQARRQGLPIDPLAAKAREGMSKGAGPDAIVSAMERVRSRYAFASEAVKETPVTQGRVRAARDALVDALAAGLTPDDADKIIRTLNAKNSSRDSSERIYEEELVLAVFSASRDMARLGVTSETTTGALTEALEKEYTAEDMEQMRQAFMVQSRQNEPDGLAHRYSNAIRSGWTPKDGDPPRGPGSGNDTPGVGRGSGGSGSSGSGSGSGGAGGNGSGGGDPVVPVAATRAAPAAASPVAPVTAGRAVVAPVAAAGGSGSGGNGGGRN